MVRSVTTFDPEWTDTDIAAAMAWAEDTAGRCKGCGLPRAESFHPDHAGNYYFAEAVVCHACEARDRAQRDASEKKQDGAGVYWAINERG